MIVSRPHVGATLGALIAVLSGCGGGGGSEPLAVDDEPIEPNQAPVAEAGDALNAREGETVELVGTATDADGSVVSFAWRQVDGLEVAL
ncbi:MAG: hypothetical protein AAFX85_19075, partial [Pseudomonadota bacterium]